MGIYAKAKYNRPGDLTGVVNNALNVEKTEIRAITDDQKNPDYKKVGGKNRRMPKNPENKQI
ncbi:MAG: hypothetical protein IKF59_13775 [Lachnospiraceae bacterium]|nr:hypothetical protein [Lachnospiraceae bacterium]